VKKKIEKKKIETKHFVNKKGAYIGGFCGVEPPKDSIEVDTPPEDARQTYKDGQWSEYVPVKGINTQSILLEIIGVMSGDISELSQSTIGWYNENK